MPDPDYTAWRFWFEVGDWAFDFAVLFFVWMRTRSKSIEAKIMNVAASSSTQLEDYRQKMATLCGQRLEKIESIASDQQNIKLEMAHMPSHRDIKDLSARMDMLHGGIKELSGRLSGMNRAVDLINEFLIQQGGKGAS
jgi:hypothetical protein